MDMACHGPKVRLSRKLQGAVAEIPKHVNLKNTKRPGMHGFRQPKLSQYGMQLMEKQKVAIYYNVGDAQLRRYMKMASAASEPSTVVLQRLVEMRLDNIIRRIRWARTIWQAREMVSHGHFYVNNKQAARPSYNVKPGDTITVKEGSREFVKTAAAAAAEATLYTPEWLAVDQDNLTAKVLRKPTYEEIRTPLEIDYSKVVEYYRR
jgi:small subunit ribosomal protein S4